MNDPLIKIGSIIKAAREQSGLSIEELAAESRVSSHHIQNIEIANRKELPEEAYLTGFLNKIFKSLKIENAAGLVTHFKQDEGDYIIQSLINNTDPEEDLGESSSYFKVYHLYILLGILLLFISWFVINNANQDNEAIVLSRVAKEKVDSMKNQIETADVTKQVEKVEVKKTTQVEEVQEEIQEEIRNEEKTYEYKNTSVRGKGSKSIMVRVREIAWVQVIGMEHRNILYEGDVFPTSEPNQFRFKDDDGFIIATGNAGAFEVDTGDGFSVIGGSGQLIKWFYPKSIRRKFERSTRKSSSNQYKEQELVKL